MKFHKFAATHLKKSVKENPSLGGKTVFDGTAACHTEILATYAHDLRSPLTSIRTGIEVLRLARDNPAQVEKVIGMLERQTLELARLLDGMAASAVRKPTLTAEPAPVALANQRVLVVDDSRSAADIISLFFKMEGHDVATAYLGEDAVSLARQSQPHIVFLDLGLPDLCGYQVAARLRELPCGEQLFLVALTGRDEEDDRVKIKQAGFDMHVVKPPAPGMLRDVLGVAAARNR